MPRPIRTVPAASQNICLARKARKEEHLGNKSPIFGTSAVRRGMLAPALVRWWVNIRTLKPGDAFDNDLLCTAEMRMP